MASNEKSPRPKLISLMNSLKLKGDNNINMNSM